jgi:thiosulfate reductase cytochrome b subunit
MSGLQIFNAHPRLYWGQYGANADPAFIQIDATQDAGGKSAGSLQVGDFQFRTTGVLGVSRGSDGELSERGFPSWATIPSFQDLASGRRWHFFFAWILVINSAIYFVVSLVMGHFRRDLLPTHSELAPSHVAKDLWDHLRLKFPKGDAARHYNILQKLAYLGALLVLAPTMLATGLAMSPGGDAAFPFLLDLFGGRQSARTLHFISAMLIVLFILVHLSMVLLAGPFNEIRSMITGRYAVPLEKTK